MWFQMLTWFKAADCFEKVPILDVVVGSGAISIAVLRKLYKYETCTGVDMGAQNGGMVRMFIP